MRAFILIISGSLMAGSAASMGSRSAEPPAARETGRPVSCITILQIKSTNVHDDRTIDFVMRNGAVYRNRLSYNCPELGFQDAFTYRSSSNQLCSVDTITVLQPPGLSMGASCGLGEFQPIELLKPRKAR